MSLYKMAEKQVIKGKCLIKLFWEKCLFSKITSQIVYYGSHTSFLYIVL